MKFTKYHQQFFPSFSSSSSSSSPSLFLTSSSLHFFTSSLLSFASVHSQLITLLYNIYHILILYYIILYCIRFRYFIVTTLFNILFWFWLLLLIGSIWFSSFFSFVFIAMILFNFYNICIHKTYYIYSYLYILYLLSESTRQRTSEDWMELLLLLD